MDINLTYDIRKHLQSFAQLAVGWHYSEGGPIPQSRIDLAIKWCEWLEANNLGDIHEDAGDHKEPMTGLKGEDHGDFEQGYEGGKNPSQGFKVKDELMEAFKHFHDSHFDSNNIVSNQLAHLYHETDIIEVNEKLYNSL